MQRVLIRDTSAGYLSALWALGGSFLGRFDTVIAARTWAEAYAGLERARAKGPIGQLQVWGHGTSGQPLIGGLPVGLRNLKAAMRPQPDAVVWFRSCSVAQGQRGHQFMAEAVQVLGCTVIAHCEVISWPNPLKQGKICALRPGEAPWWPLDGAGLRSCSTFRMEPPAFAFQDGER